MTEETEESVITEEFVIFTGFEPFGEPRPPTNPSWQAVKQLTGKEVEVKDHNNNIKKVRFDTKEIPVEYGPLLEIIPELHKEIIPKLQLDTIDTNKENDTDKKIYKYYIHVGHGHDNIIHIEKLAHKDGYCLKDNDEKMPEEGVCPNYDQKEIETDVDVDRLVDHLCLKKEWKKIERSDNAGRYLCEYTFYVSLCENAKKSIPGTVLFVHVPREGCPYSIDELAQILKDIGIWVTENY